MLFALQFAGTWKAEVYLAELDALLERAGVDRATAYTARAGLSLADPFLLVNLPSLAVAEAVFARSVLVRRVLHLWQAAPARTVHEAVDAVDAFLALGAPSAVLPVGVDAGVVADARAALAMLADAGTRWRLSVESFGVTVSMEAAAAIRHHFASSLACAGPVRLRGAVEAPLCIVVDAAPPEVRDDISSLLPLSALTAGEAAAASASNGDAGGHAAAGAGSSPSTAVAASSAADDVWRPLQALSGAAVAAPWLTESAARRAAHGEIGMDAASGAWTFGGAALCGPAGCVNTHVRADRPGELDAHSKGAAPPLPSHFRRVFVGREVAFTSRPVLEEIRLSKRAYLGPTTLDPEVACLMVNLAQLGSAGDIIYDPFVGTGSVLISAARLVPGVITMGADIDSRVLTGKGGKSAASNFTQYGLPQAEILRMDNSRPPLRPQPLFSAIVTDPPYGVRAGARKSGVTEDQRRDVSSETIATWVPRTQNYAEFEVVADLIEMAAQYLAIGGRLVYIFPTLVDAAPGAVITHPCMEVTVDVEQRLAGVLARRYVVMIKTAAYDATQTLAYREHMQASAERAGLTGKTLRERMGAAYDAWAAGSIDSTFAMVAPRVARTAAALAARAPETLLSKRARAKARQVAGAAGSGGAPAAATAADGDSDGADGAGDGDSIGSGAGNVGSDPAAAPGTHAVSSRAALAGVGVTLSRRQQRVLERRLIRQLYRDRIAEVSRQAAERGSEAGSEAHGEGSA